MTVMARISREYVLQILAFAVAILDRLLIPAILLRTVGVSGFSGWTVAIAVVAFVPVLDLGFVRHFSVRLLALRAQGREADAVNEYRQGRALLTGVSVFSTVALVLWILIVPPSSGDPAIDALMPSLIFPMLAAMVLSQAIGLRQALYRAHQQFGRETLVRSAGDLLRVAVICIAATAGAPLASLGWIWLVAVILVSAVPTLVDTRLRFPGFRWRWPNFRPGDMVQAMRSSQGYWLAAISTTAFASVPLLVLGYWAAGAAVIAQFGLLRTIANLVRQVLQMFANVFGLEMGRRYALRDDEGFSKVFTEANRFLGTQAAVAAVALLMVGRELFAVWTGRDDLFDVALLALAILPPILLPGMILSMEALSYAERQWTIVRIRTFQAALTVILFLGLPIADIGLRMMAALAVGEIAGLGIPLLWAMRSVDRRLSLRRQMATGGWVTCAALVTAIVLSPTLFIPQSAPYLKLLAGAGLGAIALVFVLLFVGLTPTRRRAMLAMIGGRAARIARS